MTLWIKRLASAFAASKLTYEELEKATEIPRATLQRYITGKTKKVPIDALERIAPVLGVRAAYLMGWDDQPQKERPALFSEDELRLVNAYRQADPTYQAIALELLESHPAQSAKVARA